MIRGALAVVTFLAGLLVGGVVVATKTAASAAAPTPAPVYARYTAIAVVQAFADAGLRADPPFAAPSTDLFPVPRPTAPIYNLWPYPGGGQVWPMMSVVIAASPNQIVEWQTYFAQHSGTNNPRLFRYLIHGNAMLVFSDFVVGSITVSENSRFWAVFAAMP